MGHTPDGDVASVNDGVNGNWTYGYDAWANLLTIAKVSGYSSCVQPDNLNITVTTANQISGYAYMLICPQTLRSGSYDI